MNFPADLEQKVKLPPGVGGRSYPYQLSAKELMDNYKYAALQVDETKVAGLHLEEKTANGTRTVSLSGSASSERHPWQAITNPSGTWGIYGDSVYTQGSEQGSEIVAAGLNGRTDTMSWAILKITRNESSREIETAEIIVESSNLTSTQLIQYRPLAYIGETTSDIIQYQLEEIRIYEELIVENGAFKLQGYEVSHRNNYDLP